MAAPGSGGRLPDGTPYTVVSFAEYPEAQAMQTGQMLTWLMAGKWLAEPPEGWVLFGSHADQPDVEVEFSGSLDEDGTPLWERAL